MACQHARASNRLAGLLWHCALATAARYLGDSGRSSAVTECFPSASMPAHGTDHAYTREAMPPPRLASRLVCSRRTANRPVVRGQRPLAIGYRIHQRPRNSCLEVLVVRAVAAAGGGGGVGTTLPLLPIQHARLTAHRPQP